MSEDVAAAVQVSSSEPTPASSRSRSARRWRSARAVLLGLWVASLVMLIVVATRSWPTWSFFLMLGIYGLLSAVSAAVTFWRGGAKPVVDLLTGVVLFVAGVVFVIVFVVNEHADASGVIGSVLLFASIGLVIAWLRQQERPLVRSWLALGVGVVLILVSGLWLTRSTRHNYVLLVVLLAVAVLVAIPAWLNLVSEAALRWLADTIEQRAFLFRAWGAVVVGLVLIAMAVVFTGFVAHAWGLALVATLVAVVLMVAAVSDTRLDVAIVIGTVCVLAAAPPTAPQPATLNQDVTPNTLVALGDSYMSGEGAKAFYTGTDDPDKDVCRRAPTAYAPQALPPKGSIFDHLVFLACSGARTYNVILTPQGQKADQQFGEAGTQLDQLKRIRDANRSFKPEMVIISIGGNDAGFATLGEACLAPGSCADQDLKQKFEDNLAAVRTALDATYTSVRQVLPDVPIVAVPYPQPIAPAEKCSGFPLTTAERTWVRQFIDDLDTTIQNEATKQKLYYMDTMKSALADGHVQMCDPQNHGKPGIYPIAIRTVNGLATNRFNPATWLHNSLHPNALGHSKMLDAFQKWVNAHPPSTLTPPGQPSPSATVGAAAVSDAKQPTPPCSFTVTGPSNCSTQAIHWEAKQVLSRLWWLVILAVWLAGAWLFSVGLLGLAGRNSPRRRGP